MHIDLSKEELIDLIKAVPIRYERYTAELSPLIEWDFDMNGPMSYCWHTNMLREKSEEELYEFYKKLRNGDFYDPIPEITEYKAVTLPGIRRQFPKFFLNINKRNIVRL